MTVVAVCIPWSGAHVSTGRRDRRRWDEHVEFCAMLGEVISSVTGPVVVAGDFNQAVPRVRQPKRVFEALESVLGGFDVVTGGSTEVGPLIDHVACGPGLVGAVCGVWPNVVDGVRLSDHSGAVVDIERVVPS